MLAMWQRAADACDQVQCSDEDFVRAHFLWCHERWGRRPWLSELASKASVQRANDYCDRVDRGEIDPEQPVRSAAKVVRSTPAQRSAQSERELRALMKAWQLTEEGVFLKFAPTAWNAGHSLFDLDWLLSKPTYRRLLREGRVRW